MNSIFNFALNLESPEAEYYLGKVKDIVTGDDEEATDRRTYAYRGNRR